LGTDIEKELNTLKMMADNWLRGFKTWHEPGEDIEYICTEFIEDIQTHLMPYLERLYKMEYVGEDQVQDLMQYFNDRVKDLKEYGERRNKDQPEGTG